MVDSTQWVNNAHHFHPLRLGTVFSMVDSRSSFCCRSIMLTLQLGSCAGFGGDSSITHTRKSRAVSPPIDTDILGSDDEDSGVLQNKLKEVFGACAR